MAAVGVWENRHKFEINCSRHMIDGSRYIDLDIQGIDQNALWSSKTNIGPVALALENSKKIAITEDNCRKKMIVCLYKGFLILEESNGALGPMEM